ncbi:hypothetical protein ACLMAB_05530 [Brevibacillus laterosporus]
MELKSIYKIGTKVKIISGRFAGFEGIVEDHFSSQNTETGKYEAGVTVVNVEGERKDAFDRRIEVFNKNELELNIEKWMSAETAYQKSVFIGVCATVECLDGKTRFVGMRLYKDGKPNYTTYVIKDGKKFGSRGSTKIDKKIYGLSFESEMLKAYERYKE